MVLAIALANRRIVDTRKAAAHQTILAKVPILVAIGAKPIAAVVVPLIGEAYRYAVLPEAPQLLDKPIV